MIERINKTNEEWKKVLSSEQYHILREKGTERPFTGKYDEHFGKGMYVCAACGEPLFTSEAKYNSGCGWPAFFAAMDDTKVIRTHDFTFGMRRTEITCAKCGGHLGHVFDDGPQPTGERFCVNSASLEFKEEV